MQRSLMTNLMTAFPTAQFVIATHSPFMVSSVRDSNVFVLDYRDAVEEQEDDSVFESSGNQTKLSRMIESEKLDTVNRAGTASEILRDVLGVPATIPEWVESKLTEIVSEYRGIQISNESLNSLRARLQELGFADLYAQALSELVSEQ